MESERKVKEVVMKLKNDGFFNIVTKSEEDYYGENEKASKFVFGRMSFYNNGKPEYPLYPTFLNFSRCNFFEEVKTEKFHVAKTETKVLVNKDKIQKKVAKRLLNQLRNVDRRSLLLGVLNDLRHEENSTSENIDTELSDLTYDEEIDMAVALETAINNALDNLNIDLEKLNVKKKVVLKKKIGEPITVLKFTFNFPKYDVVVWIEDPYTIEILKYLLPLAWDIREKIQLIRRYRANGVPETEKDYEVKGVFDPFDHQWTMYKVHCLLDKSANLSQMGTGKTFSVLMSIDKRFQLAELERGKVLIVCPTNVMENWEKEIKRHTPHLTSGIIKGTYGDRMGMILDQENRPDILIVNYESFTMKFKAINKEKEEVILPLAAIFKAAGFQMVVLDEAHKIKNPEAKRTGNIINAFDEVKYKIIMSGTISANKLHDLHTPFIFLNRARNFNSVLTQRNGELRSFGELHGDFKDTYFVRNGWNLIPKQGTVEELKTRLEEVAVRFEKEECLSLPPKLYDIVFVELSNEQKQLYIAIQNKLQTDLAQIMNKEGKVSALNVLAMMTKLAEAANGWIYDMEGKLIEFPWNPKLDALMEVIEGLGDTDKAVIWSRFTQDLHLVQKKLAEIYGEDAVAVIHGGESCSVCGAKRRERFQIQTEFNDKDSKLKFVVGNPAAGGVGIDLTGATYEFYFSNSFVKVDRKQSEDRCHRPGMRDNLTIIDIVARCTIDEQVLETLKSWKNMTFALMEGIGLDPRLFNVNNNLEEPAIKLQKQGDRECFLATIAMLSGKTLDEVREFALALSGEKSWKYHKDLAVPIAYNFMPQTWATEYEKHSNELHAKINDPEQAKKIKLDMKDTKIPTTGIGALLIIWDKLGLDGHIVAYQNGMIYDPSFDEPLEGSKYIVKIWEKGGWLSHIFPLENGEGE